MCDGEERKLPAMYETRKRVRMSLSIVVIGMKNEVLLMCLLLAFNMLLFVLVY